MPVTCPTQLIPHDLVILIIFGEECKLWCASLCSFFSLPLFHPSSFQIFSSASFSQTNTGHNLYTFMLAAESRSGW
jgi:hypothetical protein